MRTRIVRIGNSQGVRIPKVLLEEAGIEGDVELRIEEGRLLIENVEAVRQGWEEAARSLSHAECREPDPWGATDFDESEWVLEA